MFNVTAAKCYHGLFPVVVVAPNCFIKNLQQWSVYEVVYKLEKLQFCMGTDFGKGDPGTTFTELAAKIGLGNQFTKIGPVRVASFGSLFCQLHPFYVRSYLILKYILKCKQEFCLKYIIWLSVLHT